VWKKQSLRIISSNSTAVGVWPTDAAHPLPATHAVSEPQRGCAACIGGRGARTSTASTHPEPQRTEHAEDHPHNTDREADVVFLDASRDLWREGAADLRAWKISDGEEQRIFTAGRSTRRSRTVRSSSPLGGGEA